MRAIVFLEFGRHRVRDAFLRPQQRAPTKDQAVVSYTPFTGLMRTGCPQTSATRMCPQGSVPGKGVYGGTAGLRTSKLQVASKARSYTFFCGSPFQGAIIILEFGMRRMRVAFHSPAAAGSYIRRGRGVEYALPGIFAAWTAAR